MKAILSIALSCVVALTGFNTCYASTIIKKRVDVEVISGTYAGQKGDAIFSYDKDKATGATEETIDGNEIVFNFLGQTVTGKPQIILSNGTFKNVAWVASVKSADGKPFNFGFNAGFERNQFNRPSEAFIANGENYFGYLFPDTYVDGAGKIKYSDMK